jgi:dihydroorotase
MAKTFDLLIKGGTIQTHERAFMADIGVNGAHIQQIGTLGGADAGEIIDASGLTILPGVIDTQVHFREPGNEHKEDLATGSEAAIMGGVTAVFEMPNTNPLTTTQARIEDKLARAKGRMWCDHAFYVGATPENADQLAELEKIPGTAGIKVFMGSSTGNLLVEDDENLRRVLSSGKRRAAIHSEDEARLNERKPLRLEGDPRSHPVWRDEETAIRATRRLLNIAEDVGRKVHILHVTTAQEMDILKDAKAGTGDLVSVEVTPQHLTLAAPDCYQRLGTYAQMNPPIRDASHQDALWAALREGTIDVIGTDHSPHTAEEKAGVYPATPSGMPIVQMLIPLMLNHVAMGRLSMERLVDLTSWGARRIFGLKEKGAVIKGNHADFTIVDTNKKWTVTKDWQKSRCTWSAFEGAQLTGKPIGTIIRGVRVMWEDSFIGLPDGQPIRFDMVDG